jgi:hypothetical protein
VRTGNLHLVPQGRLSSLSLAQDVVLGWHARLNSPAGTTENSVETVSWILGADREFSIPDDFDWKGLGLPPANFQSSPFDKLRAGSAGLSANSPFLRRLNRTLQSF